MPGVPGNPGQPGKDGEQGTFFQNMLVHQTILITALEKL